jgi:hypothetical protein
MRKAHARQSNPASNASKWLLRDATFCHRGRVLEEMVERLNRRG